MHPSIFKKLAAAGALMGCIILSWAGAAEAFSISECMLTADEPIESAEFGRSVATDANLVVVGAAEGSDNVAVGPGAAYVFRRIGKTYVQEAKLVAADGEDGAEFGRDVAVKGNTVVVGARFASNETVERSGAAYVYKKQSGRWVFTQKLTAQDGAPEDNFGRAVDLDQNLLAVSARKEDVTEENDGAVYVFRNNKGVWIQEAKLTAGDGSDGARFGQSVAVSGHLIVVGARDANTPGAEKAGAIYLFERVGRQWVQTAKLSAQDGKKGDQFGFNVAIAGNLIAVGARRADFSNSKDAGAVYLFGRMGKAWREFGKLTASDGKGGDEFGHSVAMSAGLVAAGARRADIDGDENQGAVYLFRRSDGTWKEAGKIPAFNGGKGDEFGHSLAASRDSIVVGANVADFDEVDQGAAYVYRVKKDRGVPGGPFQSSVHGPKAGVGFMQTGF